MRRRVKQWAGGTYDPDEYLSGPKDHPTMSLEESTIRFGRYQKYGKEKKQYYDNKWYAEDPNEDFGGSVEPFMSY